MHILPTSLHKHYINTHYVYQGINPHYTFHNYFRLPLKITTTGTATRTWNIKVILPQQLLPPLANVMPLGCQCGAAPHIHYSLWAGDTLCQMAVRNTETWVPCNRCPSYHLLTPVQTTTWPWCTLYSCVAQLCLGRSPSSPGREQHMPRMAPSYTAGGIIHHYVHQRHGVLSRNTTCRFRRSNNLPHRHLQKEQPLTPSPPPGAGANNYSSMATNQGISCNNTYLEVTNFVFVHLEQTAAHMLLQVTQMSLCLAVLWLKLLNICPRMPVRRNLMPIILQKQQITVYDTDRSQAAICIKFLFIIIPVISFNKIS